MVIISCAPIRPVEYRSVSDFKVRAFTALPEFSVNVNMYNPNTVGCKLKDFSLRFDVANTELAFIQLDELSRVPSRDNFTLPIEGFTTLTALTQLVPVGVNNLFTRQDIPVKLTGQMTVKKFIFKKTFPFYYEDVISTSEISMN